MIYIQLKRKYRKYRFSQKVGVAFVIQKFVYEKCEKQSVKYFHLCRK